MRRSTARTVLVTVVAVGFAGVAIVIAARAFGWQSGPLYFLVAMTPYVGGVALLLIVVAGLLRNWWLVLTGLCAVAVVVAWWLPAFRPSTSASRWDLQVMTTNLRFGRADPDAVVATVRDHGVDLLSVQELTPEAVAALEAAGLRQALPYRFVRPSASTSGTGIWSAYPMADRMHTEDLVFENLSAAVTTPHGEVTFFAVHPIPPAPLDGTKGVAVFAGVQAFVSAAPGPAIVAGDYNATRDNAPIKELEAIGYVDAASAAGAGMVRTWRNDLPFVPSLVALDHVLTRSAPVAHEVVIVDIPATDHRAVIARL